MYYSSKEPDYTWLKVVAWIVVVWITIACLQSCERSRRDMIYISDGYCYKEDTQIIYEEYFTGRMGADAVYTPYYDENGKLCKYDLETGEWIPIKN